MAADHRGRTGKAAPVNSIGAGVVEDDVTAGREEAMPSRPIELAPGLRMIAVDEHQIDFVVPVQS